MSTTARRYWLKALRAAGVKHFRATSGLGLPYICHVGDFAGEAPFYSRRHSVEELTTMAEWCRTIERPVIFDIGANNGFIATQLAQLLKDQRPLIYAFEPVPSTFAQLKLAVEALHLTTSVIPICCALSDLAGITTLAFNPRESLFAQVRDDTLNPRAGIQLAAASTVTVDQVVASIAISPHLLKIDVEGSEPRVFAGAQKLLTGDNPPAICFEWNPLTLNELGVSAAGMLQTLKPFVLHYIDDFEGGRMPTRSTVSLESIDWVCNVFAHPASSKLMSSPPSLVANDDFQR